MKVTGLTSPISFDVIIRDEKDFHDKMRALVGDTWHGELPKFYKSGMVVSVVGVIESVEVKRNQ
jgi:hypothetical protein